MKIKFKGIQLKILVPIILNSIILFLAITALGVWGIHYIRESIFKKNQELQQIAIKNSKTALKDQIKGTFKSLAQDQAEIIDIQLKRIEHELSVISSLIQEPMHALEKAPVKERQSVQPKVLQKILALFAQLNENLSLTYFVFPDGEIIRSRKTNTPKNFSPVEREWFKEAVKQQKTVWIGPYKSASSRKMIMTCATPVYSDDKKLVGVLGVDINIHAIINKFMTNKLHEGRSVLLLDANGDIIIEKSTETSTIHWNDSVKRINAFKKNKHLLKFKKAFTENDSGVFTTFSRFGYPIFIAYATIPATHWRFVIRGKHSTIIYPAVVTENKINKATSKIKGKMDALFRTGQFVFYTIIVLLICFIVFLSFWISRNFTAPLVKLREEVLYIGKGHLEHKIEIHTGDEIEELGETFNQMTENLKKYIVNLKQATIAKERIERDLKHAHDIQASMLPNKFPAFPEYSQFDLFAKMLPARAVGGDFYDYLLLDEKHLFFCIGDVSGKGVPAALFMAITKTLMREEALRGHSPEKILKNVNNSLVDDNDSCMFATVFCGILDIQNGELCFSNAGHNPPIILKKRTKQIEFLDINKGFVVGPMEAKQGQYKLEHISLEKNDIICLYTDGITEAMNEDNNPFSDQKLLELMKRENSSSPQIIIEKTFASVLDFAGNAEQFDDITMLTIQYKGT